jgi:hypothetical protein
MARGINRALQKSSQSLSLSASSAKSVAPSGKPCVFISYHRADEKEGERIAQYLLEAGVDIYFDKYDKTLDQLVEEGNANKVTKRIQDGINYSSHMLCIVSTTTVQSYWVPFEVGYGYEQRPLAILTLKGVTNAQLPHYMKTTKVIRGTKTLNEFISQILGKLENDLIAQGAIKKHNLSAHPLDSVLDWQV